MSKRRLAFHWEDEVYRVDVGDGLWVDILQQMSHFDHELYNGLLLDIGPRLERLLNLMATAGDDKTPDIEPIERQTLLAKIDMSLLMVNIREWNIIGRDGEIAPIDLFHLQRLDKSIAQPVLDEIRKRNDLLPKGMKGR